MNARSSPWLGVIFAFLIALLVACLAALAILTALVPSIGVAFFNQSPAALPSPVLPTVQPTANFKCATDDCANACLSKLTSILQTTSVSESEPRSAGQPARSHRPVELVSYRIQNDQLASPVFADHVPPSLSQFQQDKVSHEKIWQYFVAIIPADQRSELAAYIVSTDGKGNMLASVDQSTNHPDLWALNVDIADAGEPRDLTFTLLHEYGHLLTLNSSQVTPDAILLANPNNPQIYQQEISACPQFLTSAGCSKPDSYINQFYAQFWTELIAEWSKVNAARGQSDYSELLTRFYRNHPTQFNTPYSSTSPEEDIAESWSYFVLTPKPPDDSIASHKVLFYYNYPELVDLRNQIIAGICNYADNH